MKLTEPIPILTNFKNSKSGAWFKRHSRISVFGISPLIALLVFGPVYLALFQTNGKWSHLLFLIGFALLIVLTILVFAVNERVKPAGNMTSAERARYKKSFALKTRQKDEHKS